MSKILFLSALDFKEKSIQVIRKTPEAYAYHGWTVSQVVARDTSKLGDYSYEPVFDPSGVEVVRFCWPLRRLRELLAKFHAGLLLKILLKCITAIVVIRLAYYGWKAVLKNGKYDVIYGYECHGVLASAVLRVFLTLTFKLDKTVFVSRFQGTKLSEAAESRQYLKLLANFEHVIANWLPCDLCVMTNDGTRGRQYLHLIRARYQKLRYYTNGVEMDLEESQSPMPWSDYGVEKQDKVILTVSRLVEWKRLDRVLHSFVNILNQAPSRVVASRLRLLIVGEGGKKDAYERLAERLSISQQVTFVGAVAHSNIHEFYKRADYFFSFYDLSNVGNPLQEAILHKKVIFTLNNGDTGRWIQNCSNGFIFPAEDKKLPNRVADAFWKIESDSDLQSKIRCGVQALAQKKLWSWQDRMNREVKAVQTLLDTDQNSDVVRTGFSQNHYQREVA